MYKVSLEIKCKIRDSCMSLNNKKDDKSQYISIEVQV